MNDPTMVSLGDDLYSALWDDPKRPTNYTVERWARELLDRAVKEDE